MNDPRLIAFERLLAIMDDLREKLMSAASDILKLIKEKEIEFVDLRFTDPRGKLQHMTQDLTTIDEDFLNDSKLKSFKRENSNIKILHI